jgi:hypothetical protein
MAGHALPEPHTCHFPLHNSVTLPPGPPGALYQHERTRRLWGPLQVRRQLAGSVAPRMSNAQLARFLFANSHPMVSEMRALPPLASPCALVPFPARRSLDWRSHGPLRLACSPGLASRTESADPPRHPPGGADAYRAHRSSRQTPLANLQTHSANCRRGSPTKAADSQEKTARRKQRHHLRRGFTGVTGCHGQDTGDSWAKCSGVMEAFP